MFYCVATEATSMLFPWSTDDLMSRLACQLIPHWKPCELRNLTLIISHSCCAILAGDFCMLEKTLTTM